MLLMELNNFIILTSQYYFNQLYYVVHISINPRGEGGGGGGWARGASNIHFHFFDLFATCFFQSSQTTKTLF